MRHKEHLDVLQSARLLTYLEANFKTADCTDEEFAEKASAELGFSVNRRHVTTRRMALGFDSHRKATSSDPLEPRLARVEQDGAALTGLVDELRQRIDLVIKVLNLQQHFKGTAK